MFGFDGEYRRRPVQSLGGASHTYDRDTAIRKAALERQKRNDLRQKVNGAVVLQSYARSFIHRQRLKRAEREAFDAYLYAHRDRVIEDESLSFLLRRLSFFYSSRVPKDSERLVSVHYNIHKSIKCLYVYYVSSRLTSASKFCAIQHVCCNSQPTILSGYYGFASYWMHALCS